MKNQFETYNNIFLDEYNTTYYHYSYHQSIKMFWKPILLEAQNHRCCWCGIRTSIDKKDKKKKNYATIEHIVPKSEGGIDHSDNFAISCQECNNIRGNKSIEDFTYEITKANKDKSIAYIKELKFGGIPYYSLIDDN